MAQPDITQQIIQQASSVTLFGHTFNVFATILLTMFALLLYGFYKVQKDKTNPFDWSDMITGINQTTGKREASATKIMQLLGGITGTFVVVKLAILGTISWDIFAVYLTYVASADGFTRFMLAKYGVKVPDPTQPVVTVSGASVKPNDND